MLSKLVYSNFYSFAEEAKISFEVGKKPTASYYDIIDKANGLRLNKVLLAALFLPTYHDHSTYHANKK